MKPVDIELKFAKRQYKNYCRRQETAGFNQFAERIIKRDDNTCRVCGFKALKHMSIMNIDHNYLNNTAKNLITVCPLCLQCHFVENIGVMQNSGGTLIYMPEISQSRLNGIVHTLFCAIANATTQEQSAQDVYNGLRLRAKPIEKVYGENRSDPKVFGEMVLNSTSENQAQLLKVILKDFRILPKLSSFSDQIKSWSEDATSALETDLSVYGINGR